jgi:hypothetical protein
MMLKLRDWIDINKINWCSLSLNPNAIELLKKIKIKFIEKICLKIQMQLHY